MEYRTVVSTLVFGTSNPSSILGIPTKYNNTW